MPFILRYVHQRTGDQYDTNLQECADWTSLYQRDQMSWSNIARLLTFGSTNIKSILQFILVKKEKLGWAEMDSTVESRLNLHAVKSLIYLENC